MSDSYDDDSEGKDTQVLKAEKKTPNDLEGTIEMDRESLFRHLQNDKPTAERPEVNLRPSTIPMEKIEEVTDPAETVQLKAVQGRTASFAVPDSVMESLKDPQLREYRTLDIPLEAIEPVRSASEDRATMDDAQLVEFASVIDANGRVPIPASKLVGKVAPGARVFVVIRVMDE